MTVTIDLPRPASIAERAAAIFEKQDAELEATKALVIDAVFDELAKRPAVAKGEPHSFNINHDDVRAYAANPASGKALIAGVTAALSEAFHTVRITPDGYDLHVELVGRPGDAASSTALVPITGGANDKNVANAIAKLASGSADTRHSRQATFKTLAKSPGMRAVWKLIATKLSGTRSIELGQGVYLRPDGKVTDPYGDKKDSDALMKLDMAQIDAAVTTILADAQRGDIPKTRGNGRFLFWYTS